MKAPVVIDAAAAGEVPVTAVVAGVPLVTRLLRGLARAGCEAAEIRARDREQRAAISRCLADHEIPASLAVTIELDGGDDDTALLAHAIYDRADLFDAGDRSLAPLLAVERRADVRRARSLLFASIRKPMAMDGVVAYFIQRPLSRIVSGLLLDTPVTANQATIGALLCGVIGAVIATGGDHKSFAIAGALYFASGVLDCVDGELARLRLVSSRLGEWLDSMTDEITTLALLAGIGVGLHRGGESALWMWAALGGVAVGAMVMARLYLELHRLGTTIDTAHFPWFFRDTGSGGTVSDTRANSAFGWVIIGLGYLIRRDANVTGISLLLIAGLAKVALVLTVAAVSVVAVLAAIHFTVAKRSSP